MNVGAGRKQEKPQLLLQPKRDLLSVRVRVSVGRAETDFRGTLDIGGQHPWADPGTPGSLLSPQRAGGPGVTLAGGAPEVPTEPGSDFRAVLFRPSPSRPGKRQQPLGLFPGFSNPAGLGVCSKRASLWFSPARTVLPAPEGMEKEEEDPCPGKWLTVLLELCAEVVP